MERRRIAVVGGGVAGTGAAWLLARRHDVTLLEAEPRIGGHTHTVTCELPEGPVPVDTGFIVYNEPNYPQVTALFDHLRVPTQPSEMSFAFAATDLDLEYSGSGLGGLFAQRRNLLRPGFWRMVRDILHFNGEAGRRLTLGLPADLALGELLDELGLGAAFRRYYLLPMSAAIWSCPQDVMLRFPAQSFLRFFHNHGLIQLRDRPQWRTVSGGGRQYLERLRAGIQRVVTSTPVRRVVRGDDREGVVLLGDQGELGRFDDVVIAAHADEALAMLDRPSVLERSLLGAFGYQGNDAWLHTDARLMPRRRPVWSSWNHVTRRATDGSRPVSVTYWMNRLQNLPTATDLFVTLNPLHEPAPETLVRRQHYAHPVFDRAAMRAQRLLPMIQGRDRVWYCGSYHGYGFHEDAFASAVGIAERLGAPAPWRPCGAPEPVATAPSPEARATP